MKRDFTIIVVKTIDEEGIVLRSLTSLTSLFGTPIAPVLDIDGLPERITDFFHSSQLTVKCETFEGLTINSRRKTLRRGVLFHDRPGAVLVSAGVDQNVQNLAAGLCKVEPLQFPQPSVTLLNSISKKNRSALLLLNPLCTSFKSILLNLKALASAKVAVGVLYAINPTDARFNIIKTLFIGTLASQGQYALLSGTYPPSEADRNSPGRFWDLAKKEPTSLFKKKQDLLVLSGHSNALDSAIHKDLILCSRESKDHDPKNFERGVFPCVNDGVCFRQATFGGKDAYEKSGLVGINRFRAAIVVMSGCNLIALGKSWFSPTQSLTYQCTQTESLAVIAAAAASLAYLELDFLCMTLIAEGLPLGQVVSEINQVRGEVYGDSLGLPPEVGPFILIGNPCLRVKDFELQTAEANIDENNKIHIKVSGILIDKERGAWVRVEMPRRRKRPYIILDHIPLHMWCKGIWHRRGKECMLYLWLGGEVRGLDDELIGELHDSDPWEDSFRAIQKLVSRFPFWSAYLGAYQSAYKRDNLHSEVVDQTLLILPRAIRALAEGAIAMKPSPGILAMKSKRMSSPIWDKSIYLVKDLLNCAIEIACTFGTIQSSGWHPHNENTGSVGPLGQCPCRQGVLWAQAYRGLHEQNISLMEYYCSLCGPVGFDDGRRLIRLEDVSHVVQQGGEITCQCYCRAPKLEPLHIYCVPIIESWMKNRRMVGDVSTAVVMPQEIITITLKMKVPEDLGQGIHPFAVLGIVNGALFIWRQMVQITGNDCKFS